MAEFNLSYTAEDINTKLGKIDTLEQDVNKLNNEKVAVTPQTLTEAQKTQARENIGAIGEALSDAEKAELADEIAERVAGSSMVTEDLALTYTNLYPDITDYSYTDKGSAPHGYWIYKPGEYKGGILSVDWDTTQVASFQIILYLFDKDGNPYLNSQGSSKKWSGELCDPGDWKAVGTGSGFNTATAPFTYQIPEGCTVQICARMSGAVYPSGSSLSNSNFYIEAPNVISVTVSKSTYLDPNTKLDVSLGIENANRQLVTNEKGDIVCGAQLPTSTSLRATWDTVIHRGWMAEQAGAEVPENTLPAFWLAKEYGYNWVECDVRMTSDNIPVLAHNATITGANGTTLTVAESTLTAIQNLTLATSERFGTVRTNTLAELLDMARVLDMKVLIDIKVSGQTAMEAIAKTVLRCGMGDKVVYMPSGVDNARFIAAIDKKANFDFVKYGTEPTASSDLSAYTSLLTGANRVNLDVQANTWAFDSATVDAINAAGLGLACWNVLEGNVVTCLNAGAVRLTKNNAHDAIDFDAIYFATKSYW